MFLFCLLSTPFISELHQNMRKPNSFNTSLTAVSSQNQLFALVFTKQHLLRFTRGCDLFPSECVPAGRKLLQLLQHADGAAAEAERRADGFRQPSD